MRPTSILLGDLIAGVALTVGVLPLAEGADGKAVAAAQTLQDTWSLPGIVGGGLHMLAYENSHAYFSAASNVVRDNQGHGIFVMAADAGVSVDALLSGNRVIGNGGDQIIGREESGAILNFISAGTLSNFVREPAGSANFLYNSSSNSENGFIRINGILHPAGIDLP